MRVKIKEGNITGAGRKTNIKRKQYMLNRKIIWQFLVKQCQINN